MTEEGRLDLELLEALFRQHTVAIIETIGRERMLWLTLSPTWTIELALLMGAPFGATPAEVVEFIGAVGSASGTDWCERRGHNFWLDDKYQAEITTVLREMFPDQFDHTARQLARQILDAKLPEGTPGYIVIWATLLLAETADVPDLIGSALGGAVSTALGRADEFEYALRHLTVLGLLDESVVTEIPADDPIPNE